MRRTLLVAVCVIGLLAGVSSAAEIHYSDDFNSTIDYTAGSALTGQNSWLQTDAADDNQEIIAAGSIDSTQCVASSDPAVAGTSGNYKDLGDVTDDYGPGWVTVATVEGYVNNTSHATQQKLGIRKDDSYLTSVYMVVESNNAADQVEFRLWGYNSTGALGGLLAGTTFTQSTNMPAGEKYKMELTLERSAGGDIIAKIYDKDDGLVSTLTAAVATYFTTDELDTMASVSIGSYQSADTTWAQFDNLTFDHMPEPVTMVLLGMGGIAMTLGRRRRR